MPRAWIPRSLALAALLGGVACKDAPDRPSGERTVEPVPETPKDAPTGPFAGFDFADAKQRWQGAWHLPSNEAWWVEGDRVTVFDPGLGGDRGEMAFAIYSPCQVTITDEGRGITEYRYYALAGDALHVAPLGPFGTTLGDKAVVCRFADTLVLEGETCESWIEMFDDWKGSPSQCQISGQGDGRRFVAGEDSLRAVAGAWVPEDAAETRAKAHPDFDAAKAALTP